MACRSLPDHNLDHALITRRSRPDTAYPPLQPTTATRHCSPSEPQNSIFETEHPPPKLPSLLPSPTHAPPLRLPDSDHPLQTRIHIVTNPNPNPPAQPSQYFGFYSLFPSVVCVCVFTVSTMSEEIDFYDDELKELQNDLENAIDNISKLKV